MNTGVTYSTTHYDHYKKTGDKNYFEEIIESMIVDGISGMNDSFRNAIRNLPKEKKRMAILSILDKDLNLFKRIKALTDKSINKMDHIKDIILMLREYVKVGEVEKKKFGEVMTPLDLVKEMLNTLPEDVWSNPNLKWLDPANGTGPYPSMVIWKLMNGLKEWEPDDEKRYKHIVENMIYVCELQPKNMFLYLCAIDPFDKYKLNIYTGSFLEEGFDRHMKEVWGLENFDIIIGNPPYQEHKQGFTKTKPLWNLFVIKSIKILDKGGYLNLVHPGGWRSPKGNFRDIYNLFREKNLMFLSVNDFKRGQEIFGVGTNFDFYCLKNEEINDNYTKIVDSNGQKHEIDINKFSFIPNGDFDTYSKLIASNKDTKVDILYSRSFYGTDKSNMSNIEEKGFIYPCVYTITKKSGISLFYSNIKKDQHFGIPKVIWSNGLGTYPIIDYNGEYGLTQFSYGISDDLENLEKIKKAMESERFLSLMDFAKFTNNKYDYKVISTFRKDFWKEFI